VPKYAYVGEEVQLQDSTSVSDGDEYLYVFHCHFTVGKEPQVLTGTIK